MSYLTEKIQIVLDRIEAESQCDQDALRRAEELSDQFSDIKPKNEMPSPEQFMGLPVASKKPIPASYRTRSL